MNERLRKALRLFAVFLKIGAFTFGGGYAMIPLIQKEITEKRGWMTDDDVLEIVAIAESTPGPIAVNAATFVGFRVCGFRGALLATLGVVLPSFLIIFGISFVLRAFQSVRLVQYAFNGIRAGRAAGCVTVMVPDLMQPTEEITRLYDRKCGDLLQVRDLLIEGKL